MPCDTGFAIAVLFSRTMRLSDHRRAGTRHATTTPLTMTHARTWHAPRIVRWSRHAVRNHRYSVHSRVLRMISLHVPISACSKMSRLPSSSPCSSCYPMSSMLPALSFLLLLIPSHSSYPQVLPSYPCPPMTRGTIPNFQPSPHVAQNRLFRMIANVAIPGTRVVAPSSCRPFKVIAVITVIVRRDRSDAFDRSARSACLVVSACPVVPACLVEFLSSCFACVFRPCAAFLLYDPSGRPSQ